MPWLHPATRHAAAAEAATTATRTTTYACIVRVIASGPNLSRAAASTRTCERCLEVAGISLLPPKGYRHIRRSRLAGNGNHDTTRTAKSCQVFSRGRGVSYALDSSSCLTRRRLRRQHDLVDRAHSLGQTRAGRVPLRGESRVVCIGEAASRAAWPRRCRFVASTDERRVRCLTARLSGPVRARDGRRRIRTFEG